MVVAAAAAGIVMAEEAVAVALAVEVVLPAGMAVVGPAVMARLAEVSWECAAAVDSDR